MKSSEHVWQNEKRSVLTNPKKVKRPTRQKIHFGWVEEERARKKVLEMRKQSHGNTPVNLEVSRTHNIDLWYKLLKH